MEKFMKIIYPLLIAMVLNLSASSQKSDPGPVIDPFSNGTNVRNMIVVVSDMHLGADLAYAECSDNLGPLAKLLRQIRVSKNVKELVIAGDLIDEWFVPADVDTYDGKGQTDFVQRLAATNKIVFDVLNQIIKEGEVKVTYVPGNHDLAITAENISLVLPGISQARDARQGLGTYTPTDFPILAIEHGHRYNFFCSPDPFSNQNVAPGTIMPPGYFFTRIGALFVKQGRPAPGDTTPIVTPNLTGGESQDLLFRYWKMWQMTTILFPITNRFDDDVIITNINGFTGLYSVNDLIPAQSSRGGLLHVNLFNGIQDNWEVRQTLNNVPIHTITSRAIDSVNSSRETDYQANLQYFMNPNSDKRIVVFGHTHQPKIIASNNYKGESCIYANSGTWIDANPHQTTMNFVVITPENTTDPSSHTYVKLYNFMNDTVSMMAVDHLRYTK
jgi:UDP-2,3-diacylglucosamine pyrophosphatase LpxH